MDTVFNYDINKTCTYAISWDWVSYPNAGWPTRGKLKTITIKVTRPIGVLTSWAGVSYYYPQKYWDLYNYNFGLHIKDTLDADIYPQSVSPWHLTDNGWIDVVLDYSNADIDFSKQQIDRIDFSAGLCLAGTDQDVGWGMNPTPYMVIATDDSTDVSPLAFTAPEPDSVVTQDQEFTVYGTCPNNGQDQLALTYTIPTNLSPLNYNINCIDNIWTATSTLSLLEQGLYVTDKLSGASAFLPLSVQRTPVVIIPGIMGTELYNESDLVWPDLAQALWDVNDQFLTENLSMDSEGNSINSISTGDIIRKISTIDTFQSLVELLDTLGYEEGNNLFVIPYDWRFDLLATKSWLNQKIKAIKLQTGSSKVDIIAHSMGGLLTEAYLDQYGNNSVRKLIFVGTPHLGAPKAGKVLLEGDRFGIPWLEEDRIRDLALNSPSVYELLPGPEYFNQYQGYIKPYGFLTNKPFWDFVETKDYLLGKKDKNPNIFQKAEDFWVKGLQNLIYDGIDVYNVAGCKTGTQSGYQLAIGNSIIGRYGYSSGDGTVPLVSADYINIDLNNKFYVRDGSHSELPSMDGVRELIAGILTDNMALTNNISNDPEFCGFKGKALSWHSPVEINIYKDGKHTGPRENNAIEYGIPGVDYDVIGEEKFIFLPTDEGQQY